MSRRLAAGLLLALVPSFATRASAQEERTGAFTFESFPARAAVRVRTVEEENPARPVYVGDSASGGTALSAGVVTSRGRIGGVRGLHSLMSFEVLHGVNGERSGLDIYRYVADEAREAGEYYYGVVTPEAVLEYLGNVEAVGLAALK